MDRRKFVAAGGSLLAGSALLGFSTRPHRSVSEGGIVTVTGERSSSNGIFLSHEHIVSRFGEPPEEVPHYDYDHATTVVVPYLRYLKNLGIGTVACCTTRYFGRDVRLLRALSEGSGIQLVANTGYYGAAGDRYIPESAYTESPEKLAMRWIDEWKHGIDGTDIKPGFIKIGVDGDGLSEIDAKLVRAAAITHLETGLTIAAHTGNNPSGAKQQISILKEEGVSPEAWIWVHANKVQTAEELLKATDEGAWISLDGLRTANYYEDRNANSDSLSRHFELVQTIRSHGAINRVLLSHDGSSYPQAGKSKRSMDTLVTAFIPVMHAGGLSQSEIEALTTRNPTCAFSIAKRRI